jgi:pSer/pThr/pTyr-binding forkhead associated (FHA) protein
MPKCFFIVQRGGDIGSRINLNDLQTTIGRNPDNKIVLDDTMISRYHCVLAQDPKSGTATITDLGSTNGVMVNSEQIEPGTPFTVKNRDLIFVGKSIFNFQMRPDDYKAPPPPDRDKADPEATQTMQLVKLFSSH